MIVNDPIDLPVLGLVGPCGSGKTTISALLQSLGFRVRHIAQEHSYVPDMWLRLSNPDFLVFLDASYPETIRRRRFNWTEAEYQEQHHRLRHARAHAHLYIFTDSLTPDAVLQIILVELTLRGLYNLPPSIK